MDNTTIQIWSRLEIRNILYAIHLTSQRVTANSKSASTGMDYLNGFEIALQIMGEAFGLKADPDNKTLQLQEQPDDPFLSIWSRQDIKQRLQMLKAAMGALEQDNLTPDFKHGFTDALYIVGQGFGLNGLGDWYLTPLAQ